VVLVDDDPPAVGLAASGVLVAVLVAVVSAAERNGVVGVGVPSVEPLDGVVGFAMSDVGGATGPDAAIVEEEGSVAVVATEESRSSSQFDHHAGSVADGTPDVPTARATPPR